MGRLLPGARKTLIALAAAVIAGFAARADVYLVESNANPVAPYDSWATAATNVEAALSALGDNGTLHVGDGTYQIASQFTLNAGKTIVSENGPAKTTFLGTKQSIFYLIDMKGGATLAGVTLKNLTANEHYFGGVTLSDGTVSNCVFLAAYTINGVNNTHPAALKQTGGRVVDCAFRNSYAKAKDGTVANISAGTMEYCRVFDTTGAGGSCGALYVSGSGVVRHTLVTGSSQPNCAGIYVTGNGVVEYCTVWGNETTTKGGNAGIYVAATTASVKNTICVGNYDYTSAIRPVSGVSGYESTLTDCFTDETADPRFSAPLAEDFTLLPDSPCKGKGAYDYTLPTGNGAAIFRELIGGWRYDPQTNVFTAVVTPEGATCNPATCYWTFDGSVPSAGNHAATGLVVTNAFGKGSATVRFRATVNGSAVAVDRTDWFSVSNGYVYVVKNNPNAAAPYDTWATAAANYDTGLAALGEHMVLVISNGSYQCRAAGAMVPPRFSTIRSANGAGTVSFTLYNGNVARLFSLSKYGARVENVTFNNCCGTGGGPLDMSTCATVANCVITNLVQGNNWRTIFYASAGNIVGCTFCKGTGADNENGKGVIIDATGSTVIDRCVFSDLTRTVNGNNVYAGVVRVADGATIRNSLFVNNFFPVYSGIYVGANGHAENCTVVKNQTRVNKADNAAASAVYAADATADIVNCLVVGNVDLSGSASANVAYADGCAGCFTTCRAADTLADPDVRFTDPTVGDYTIQAKSVCVDAGTERSWMADACDLAGNPRVARTAPDIGCYENTPATALGATLSHTAVDGNYYAPQLTEFSAEITPEGASCDPATCYWTFDGREPTAADHDAVGLVVTNLMGIGDVSVAFRATVNGQPVAVDMPNWYHAKGKIVYVNASSTNPTAPYDTWATAAKTYEVGYTALGEGMEMVISNGTYAISTTTRTPPKNTTIRSANGPESTKFRLLQGNWGLVFILSNPGCTISGLTLASTHTDGGPISMSAAYCVVTNCIINVGKSGGNPWQTLVKATAGTVVDCVFTNSYSCQSSGYANQGICVTASGANTIVDRCVFADCSGGAASAATWAQGIVRVSGGATVRNSLFKDNTVPFCSIYLAANGHAENCTLVRNTAQRAASADATVGAIYAADATASVSNCLTVANIDSELASANTAYAEGCEACFTTCREADSVLDTDIKFVDAAAADYSLQAKSVCVNAGTNAGWMDGALDLAWNDRIYKGVVDIGCYEYTPSKKPGATLNHLVVDGRQFAPQLTEFSAEITPEGATCDPDTCYWTFDGREPTAEDHDATGICVTNTVGVGYVTVKFRATVNGTAVAVDEVDWYRAKGEIVYVNASGTNPVSPYETWETAATTFMDGYAALEEGMTVLITNGTYYGSASAVLDPPKNTTICSVNGPGATVYGLVKGDRGRIFNLTHTSCTLAGLGFTSSHTDGGPVLMNAAYCVITNCVFNNAKFDTCWQSIVQATAGTIVDCVFTNCYGCGNSGYCEGQGICVTASGTDTLVDRCVFAGCSGGYASATAYAMGLVKVSGGAAVRNSLFKDNTVPFCSIYVGANGRAENCTLVRNTAQRAVSADATVGAVYAADVTASVANILAVANIDSVLASANLAAASGAEGCFATCRESDTLLDTAIKFTDPAAADYSIQSKSDCVNAGTYAAWMDDALDLARNPRICKDAVDIGAYEYTPSKEIGATLSHQTVDGRLFAPQLTEFSADITPEGATCDPNACYWTFDGRDPTAADHDAVGLVVTNLVPVGSVTVKFRATVNGTAVAVDKVDWYRAKGEYVYVRKDSANPSSPYDTWETAATTFLDGFAALEESMTLVISNGNYVGRNGDPVQPPQNSTVRSVNGPLATTFSLVAGNRGRVFNLSNVGCTISGLGFNSTHTDGGPIVMSGRHCVVTNCIFDNKRGSGVHVYGRLLYATAGTVVDCVFTNNVSGISLNGNVGIAVEASGTDTLIDRCVFANNSGGTASLVQGLVKVSGGAAIRNSLFANNRAPASMIFVGASGSAEDCTVVTNRATRTKASNAAVGAVYAADASAAIVNVLATWNTDSASKTADSAAASGAASCFTTCFVGGDPRFEDATKDDYRLGPFSPCTSAGTLRPWMDGATDLGGSPRVLGRPDIGAYERYRPGATVILK